MRTFKQIQETHKLFCQLTGVQIPFDMTYLYPYELFTLKFTDEDLRLLVWYIRSRKAKGKPARELTMRSLITGPNALTWAAEDLASAKAEMRSSCPKPTPRSAILAATGRPEVKPDKVQSTAQILEHEKMAKMLAEWRAQL